MPACRRDGARETQAAPGQDPPGERGPTRPRGWEMLPISTVARPREPCQPQWGQETQAAPGQDPPGERGPRPGLEAGRCCPSSWWLGPENPGWLPTSPGSHGLSPTPRGLSIGSDQMLKYHRWGHVCTPRVGLWFSHAKAECSLSHR